MPSEKQASKRKPGPAASGNEKPPGKRSRVSRACDQCRIAREKCDGVQPTCFTCSTSTRACTYTTNPKKRGIQPGYIRTLELGLTWLFNNVPNAEVSLNKKLTQEGAASVLLGRDSNDANQLYKSWRRSQFCKDVDKLLSGQETLRQDESNSPESGDDDNDAQEMAHTSHSDPSFGHHDSISIPHIPLETMPLKAHKSDDVQATLLPSNRWRLFDVYFAHTHCWFPISEKHDLLKISYSYPDQGLALSSSMPSSGDHAELWSILAFASLQDMSSTGISETEPHSAPERLYDVARSLVPHETGAFELGHVKAFLILALVNISQSLPTAAWLLVGHAARILAGIQHRGSQCASLPRFKHVLAGCFLLDTVLAVQLQRRSYFQLSDIERIGKVDQDGLEEWQPWVGCLESGPSRYRSTMRAPVLSLSSFNYLVEVAGIMALSTPIGNSNPSPHEVIHRLELWKASLPATFDHIRNPTAAIPQTPPAMLLQLVYHCASLSLLSSQSSAMRILELLEQSRDVLGLIALPPLVQSLLEIIVRTRGFDISDQGSRMRFQKFRNEYIQIWSREWRSTPTRTAHSRHSFESSRVQIPTPESIQIQFNPPLIPPSIPNTKITRPPTSSTLLDDLLPDMNSATVPNRPHSLNISGSQPHLQDLTIPDFDGAFGAPILDHQNSVASRDLENFFDELASLDGAERLDNQPQFMQNLGFAPDANIADLGFGQLNSFLSRYILPNGEDHASLDQAHIFDGS
ncbi:uncharacterized protein BDR25DRAFT_387725 [Lindgomyces ingoldianus]|uniref:Uncharacterized protein n=1 Tax=Lindgomyces ingoldianus TaxID=673940 RepID=A0ACB6R2B4_9PLEO|nr:uncharacterized protein BDR25DRAFT_387725 [Lindgomyces ingoldianus]KAF2473464.1 hypothetical protein BDR25DRAFT_387725 [Lindgomyces ingoldianus]